MISYHGLDGFPPGGMFSYRVVGNQTTLVGFLTGRLDFIPDPLVGLDVAVHRCIKPQFSVLRGELSEFLSEGSFFGHTLVSIVVLQYESVSNKLHQIVSQ